MPKGNDCDRCDNWDVNTVMSERFSGNFTQQNALPEDAIEAALHIMRHGRLHRYNVIEGEVSEAALLEEEFADFVNAPFALAVASGGYALATALRALGVGHGDHVLTNAFTLAPVPGAIAAVGAVPVFVDVTQDLVLDLEDLARKADRASILLLSHMRGHHCDMDALMAICSERGIKVIEDCAHTMGAFWDGKASGRFGVVGCYSTQTYKHMNSGEGGLLVSDDPFVMARAILLSGSYMMYERHRAAPPPEVFEGLKLQTPNISGRMDNLRAAILRPQLKRLPGQCSAWNARYDVICQGLRDVPGLYLPQRPEQEIMVGSSIQFLLPDWNNAHVRLFLKRSAERGVELKWFGPDEPQGFTSRYSSWSYAPQQDLPQTDAILTGLMDMRIPLTFSLEDCALIARIVREEVIEICSKPIPELLGS